MMDGDLTWRQLLLEQLKQKARDQGKWRHRRDQNIWVSAAEREAQIADGKFTKPKELDRFKQRFALS
jgi:hypothetical protein